MLDYKLNNIYEFIHMKKRVLRIINRFNVGGISLNVAYLTKFLSKDINTLLIGGMHEEHEAASFYVFDDLSLHYTVINEMKRSIRPINDIRTIIKVNSFIRKFQPDIIHTHASKAGLVGRLANILSLRKKTVVVHTYHGNVFDGYFSGFTRSLIILMERFLAKHTDAIVSVSYSQKNDLIEKYKICDRNKIHVIRLGFDLSRFNSISINERIIFRNEFKISNDVIVISIVGRLVPIKNHHLFIDVISDLKHSMRKKIKAFIVGDGDEKKKLVDYAIKKKLSVSNGLDDDETDLVFTSWRRDLPNVYAGSDFVLLTSINEGTPVSIIEAMASGKVVMSTDVGGVSEIIGPESGFICPPIAGYFVSSIMEMIDNPSKKELFERNARGQVLEKFHYDRLCRDMDNLYDELLKKTK